MVTHRLRESADIIPWSQNTRSLRIDTARGYDQTWEYFIRFPKDDEISYDLTPEILWNVYLDFIRTHDTS